MIEALICFLGVLIVCCFWAVLGCDVDKDREIEEELKAFAKRKLGGK